MRILSHRTIALIISTIAVLLSVFTIVFFESFNVQQIGKYIAYSSFIIFVIMFLLSYSISKKYILQMVKPIYKAIQSSQTNSFKKISNSDSVNILERTNEEVAAWALQKETVIEELKKQEQYRKEYIGNVSHELKTPIFSIQGYISTLIDGGLHDESINMLYLEKADKAIQRMINIIQDLDKITRLETGELQLEFSNFSLYSLVKEVFEIQEDNALQRNVLLIIDDSLEPNIFVNADKNNIQIVLNNLIGNAIKYSKPQNGKVIVKVYDMDSAVLIEIVDNGIGIHQQDISRIFERFYRVDKSRSREQGGTGLGLSIVKHVLEAHKQTINVKSALHKGTSFTFTLNKSKT